MPSTKDITIPLEPTYYYHIFNRGNNGDDIFYKFDNYNYFLRKYEEYMNGYLTTLAYCLLPNHFHIIAQVKPMYELLPTALSHFKKSWDKAQPHDQASLHQWLCWSVSERIRRWKLGYAKAINNQERRTGSLFEKPFRRKLIGDDDYLRYAICYTHLNPWKHKIHLDYKTYPWSSYQAYTKEAAYTASPVNLKVDLELFGGLNAFEEYHDTVKRSKDHDDEWME